MCPACRIEMNKRIKHYSSEELSDELEDLDLKQKLNSTLDAMELSPFKTHAIAAHSVLSHEEEKIKTIKVIIYHKAERTTEAFSRVIRSTTRQS